MTEAWGWLEALAARKGLTYEPEADERWLRAFEPFITLRTPLRYGHALFATSAGGSLSLARMATTVTGAKDSRDEEIGAWVALVQDVRLDGAHVASTNDFAAPGRRRASPFAEAPDLVSGRLARTGDAAFDGAFASFAPSDSDAARAITPSLRKLVLGWRIPLHFEVRGGAFVVAPVALPADAASLEWLLAAVALFGEKASKRVH